MKSAVPWCVRFLLAIRSHGWGWPDVAGSVARMARQKKGRDRSIRVTVACIRFKRIAAAKDDGSPCIGFWAAATFCSSACSKAAKSDEAQRISVALLMSAILVSSESDDKMNGRGGAVSRNRYTSLLMSPDVGLASPLSHKQNME